MLKLVSLCMVVLYFSVLIYIKFYREPKSRKVLLVIRSNVNPVQVEWVIYSFHRFFQRYYAKTQWWLHLERGEYYYENRKIIRRHAGKFGYRVFERYYRPGDYAAIFFADPKNNLENWTYQCAKEAMSETGSEAGWKRK